MRITMLVGSIWAFYAFFIFGLTPILWPEYETQILYWSNFLQLVFLPVITVGTAIMNRDSERRAIEDHHTIRREFDLLQDAHDMLNKSLKEIGVGVRELLVRSKHEGAEARERYGERREVGFRRARRRSRRASPARSAYRRE